MPVVVTSSSILSNTNASSSMTPISSSAYTTANPQGNNVDTTTNSNFLNHLSKIVEPTNLRIIETRVDANEIISQIELELANRISQFK